MGIVLEELRTNNRPVCDSLSSVILSRTLTSFNECHIVAWTKCFQTKISFFDWFLLKMEIVLEFWEMSLNLIKVKIIDKSL